ncbi:MAG: Lhr family helicase, partial [Pseudomonas sp.]
AAPLRLPATDLEQALARLEAEGYVMRGYFHPGQQSLQWCERHLLARIHRYTVKRLRREIEPVSLQDFMRFLFDWQHLSSATRLQGPAALGEVLGQLEGYPAAAAAWESDLLPSRINDYSPRWLDESCRAGKHVWARLAPGAASNTLRSTPLVVLPRPQLNLWRALNPGAENSELSPRAQRVHTVLSEHGALFFDELVHDAHLLPSELENVLQELVGAGLVSADSFAGLRALITPASKRQGRSHRRGRGPLFGGMEDAGRWSLLRKVTAADNREMSLEHVARTLLRRYGVICWRLLEREADWLPCWRELLRCYHRLEARGEIRGGRFISGLAGEQFALPEAVALLREVRRRPVDDSLVAISASDPLNLLGTLLPGNKVPALSGNRVLYRDGLPVASLVAGALHYLVEIEPDQQGPLRDRLIRDSSLPA